MSAEPKDQIACVVSSLKTLAAERGVRFGIEHRAIELINELDGIVQRLKDELEVAKAARPALTKRKGGRL